MSHSILFRLPYRPLILTSVAGLTWGTAVYSHSRRFPIRCDAAPRPAPAYTNRYPDERLSIENRIITPNFVKQVTLGSVAGFGLGLTLRIFSKALTFGVGVGILFFQVSHENAYPSLNWESRSLNYRYPSLEMTLSSFSFPSPACPYH